MSISVVYTSEYTGTNPIFEAIFSYKIAPVFAHLLEFKSNNPTVRIFNSSVGSYNFGSVRVEVRCVDQAQLDEYLLDPNNMKTTIEALTVDAEAADFISNNNITVNVAIVNDSTHELGELSAENLAEIVSGM